MTLAGVAHFRPGAGWKFPKLDNPRCYNSIDMDPDMFYLPDGDPRKGRVREFCNTCDVRVECLQWALDHDEEWGIWGGLDSRQRHKLKKGEAA